MAQFAGYSRPVGDEGGQPNFAGHDSADLGAGEHPDVVVPGGEPGREPVDAGGNAGDDRRGLGGHDEHVKWPVTWHVAAPDRVLFSRLAAHRAPREMAGEELAWRRTTPATPVTPWTPKTPSGALT